MSSSGQNRLPYIDVLRAVAILTVLVHHLVPELGTPTFGLLHVWGGRGVDLFFILSGFLIGTTALDRADRFENMKLRQAGAYWLLRSSRIFPLYFGLLALFALALPIFHEDVAFVVRNYPLRFITFTSNYLAQSTLELGIFWSLAIEEQFYLAVGVLVLFTASRRDTLAAAFVGLSVVVIAVSVYYRFELLNRFVEKQLEEVWFTFALFHSTLARMDQLAIGLSSAVLARTLNATALARSERGSRLVTWLAVGALLAMMTWYPHLPVWGFFVLGVGFAIAVLIAQRPAARVELRPWERKVLAPLASIGQVSFGLYVFHPITRPLATSAGRWLSETFQVPLLGWAVAWSTLAVWLAITWTLAWVSYRWFESPILQWARRRSSQILAGSTARVSADVALK